MYHILKLKLHMERQHKQKQQQKKFCSIKHENEVQGKETVDHIKVFRTFG